MMGITANNWMFFIMIRSMFSFEDHIDDVLGAAYCQRWCLVEVYLVLPRVYIVFYVNGNGSPLILSGIEDHCERILYISYGYALCLPHRFIVLSQKSLQSSDTESRKSKTLKGKLSFIVNRSRTTVDFQHRRPISSICTSI